MENDSSLTTNIGDNFSAVLKQGVNGNDGLVQDLFIILEKFSDICINLYFQHGFLKFAIFFLAIVGLTSIVAAILGKAIQSITWFFYLFVLTPTILIVNLLNKKKRKERLSAWGEFKKDAKKENKKISKKMWVGWALLKVLLPLLIIAFIIFNFFF